MGRKAALKRRLGLFARRQQWRLAVLRRLRHIRRICAALPGGSRRYGRGCLTRGVYEYQLGKQTFQRSCTSRFQLATSVVFTNAESFCFTFIATPIRKANSNIVQVAGSGASMVAAIGFPFASSKPFTVSLNGMKKITEVHRTSRSPPMLVLSSTILFVGSKDTTKGTATPIWTRPDSLQGPPPETLQGIWIQPAATRLSIPSKKCPVKPSPTPELPQMRLNNAETGPFTGTLSKSS